MTIRARRVGNTTLSEAHRVQEPFSITRRELMSGHMQSAITDHHPQRVAIRKNTRWGAILVGMVALVTAFAVAAQAGVTRPPVTKPLPTTLAPPLTIVAPTPDLTAVANAISRSHKSLEIVVTVKPGLALTGPVTISIRFINSAGVPKVVAQCYVPSTGNRIVFHDVEGNGQPRRVSMTATLSQDKFRVGDKGYSFTMPGPWYFNLDPLFDVSITPLRFKMTSDCEKGLFEVGKSEIVFSWTSPEGGYREKKFSTTKGKTVTINEFAWARQEASASAKLFWPQWGFYESDVKLSGAYLGGFSPPTIKLLPGSSGYVGRSLTAGRGQSDCTADIAFDITIRVRKYAGDSPGGTGCFPSAIQQ